MFYYSKFNKKFGWSNIVCKEDISKGRKKSLVSKMRIVLGRSRSRGVCGYFIDVVFLGY